MKALRCNQVKGGRLSPESWLILFFSIFPTLSAARLADNAPPEGVTYAKLLKEAFDLQAKEPASAAEDFAKALAIEGRDGDVWSAYGSTLKGLNRDREAIAAFRLALKYGGFNNKWDAGLHIQMARCLAKLGDDASAWKELNLGMDRGFRDLGIVQTDKELLPLHANRGWHKLAADDDTSKMSRSEGWRYDLWVLNRELRRVHLDPYTLHKPAEMDAYVRELDRAIPALSDNRIKMRFAKFVRMFGDAHTRLRITPKAGSTTSLPIVWSFFADGAYITATDPQHSDLLGAKIDRIAGKAPDEITAAVSDYIPQDNDMELVEWVPIYLCQMIAVDGMGLANKDGTLSIETEDVRGMRTEHNLKGDTTGLVPGWKTIEEQMPGGLPRYLRNRQAFYWMEPIPEMKALYFQYNAVTDMPSESVAKFAARLEDEFVKHSYERLIVDCRWNGGGNSFLNTPLVNTFIGLKQFRKPNRLFIIMGRKTFSGCQNFITDIGRALQPVYVGEPSGSHPNFVGESVPFWLPYSKITGSVSDLYWQRSWPMDYRKWIAPDLPTPVRFADYKAGRDVAMEAISEYVKVIP